MNKNLKRTIVPILAFIAFIVLRVIIKDSREFRQRQNQEEKNSIEELSDESFNDFLFKVSDEINKKCPMTVDKETRLDNTVALSNSTLQYNYTLVNLEKKDIDIELVKENFIPLIIKNVKTNPGLKVLRDRDVTLSYYYTDKFGDFVFTYKVTPELYK